jgi:hypothetical protein
MATKKTAAKAADPLAKDPAVSTTDGAPGEEKAAAGAPENKAAFPAGSRESVAHHAVPMSKAYGKATKEEHRRSGYNLPDSFYDESPSEEMAQHKVPGNQHGAK